MDKICDAFISADIKSKYNRNYKPPNIKPKPPQEFFNSNIVTARPLPFISKTSKSTKSRTSVTPTRTRPTTTTTRIPTTTARAIEITTQLILPKKSKNGNKSKSSVRNQIVSSVESKGKRKNSRRNNQSKNSNVRNKKLKESPRSSGSRSSGKSSGFIVVNDPERRRKLRSYWMRAGR